MWTVTNQTPFAAERGWVRDRDGAEFWLVAVKGTFDIGENGQLRLSEEQTDVLLVPEFNGDPNESSLKYDTDLPRTKPGTDVLVNGQAYAPQGEPARAVDVSLRVANIDKRLRVTGDRIWQGSLLGTRLSEPDPFTSMPITYERAFGGYDRESSQVNEHTWDERNPAGVGFAARAEHLSGKPAPNVEYPGTLINSPQSRPQPAGFGPIAGHWKPRVELGGTYDEKWEATRLPLLPEDFDDRFYHAAPEDQRVAGHLHGGEAVELTNMTPNGLLRFRVPSVRIGFRTIFQDRKHVHHRAAIHSLIIEPDVPRVMVVWHSQLRVHNREHLLLTTVVHMKRRLRQPAEPWEAQAT